MITLDPMAAVTVSSPPDGLDHRQQAQAHPGFWAVRSEDGELICVCVYKRGALEVARRLGERPSYCLRDASPPAASPSHTAPSREQP